MKKQRKSPAQLLAKRLKSNYRFHFPGNDAQKNALYEWFIKTERLRCSPRAFYSLLDGNILYNDLIPYYGKSNELPLIFSDLIQLNFIQKHDRYKAVLRHWFRKKNGFTFTQEDFDTAEHRGKSLKIDKEISDLIKVLLKLK